MDVASGDFLVLAIVEDDVAVFEENAGLGGDLVIRGEEGFEVGFVDGELVFGAVFEDEGVGGGDVEDDAGFLGEGLAVGFAFDDVVDDGGYAGHVRELNSDQIYYSALNGFKFMVCVIKI